MYFTQYRFPVKKKSTPEMSGSVKSAPKFGSLPYTTRRQYELDAGYTKRFLRDRLSNASSLYRKDLKGHFGCVNAIEFSNDGGQWIASGGDDRRIMLWNTERALDEHGQPQSMEQEHNSNIFALAFDHNNSKIFSGGNDELVLVHDINRGCAIELYRHEDAVYGLAADPLNDSVFASACADGRVLIFDIRAPASEDPFCLANYIHPMHSVMYNPSEPRLLVTANSKEGVGLWDIRKPRSCLMRYGTAQQSCMSVRFNQTGSHLLALRRRRSPILFATQSPKPLFRFDHPGYLNSCTMKSCSFAGENDEYVLSGSDDFNLYMWKIPYESYDISWVGEAHMVLQGHRSVVNQVRSNPSNQLIISSGVEKIIKVWSPFLLPDCEGSLGRNFGSVSPPLVPTSHPRPIYTHEEYINLVRRSGTVMSHDYTHQSTEEDPCMMAFFDSLIQRELEGWSSSDENEDTDSEPEYIRRIAGHSDASLAGSDTPDGDMEREGEGDGEGAAPNDQNPFTIAFASLMARQELAVLVTPEEGGRLLELNLSLADDIFNRREEQRPSTSQGGAGTSSQDAGASSEFTSEVMPGQRPIPNRRSISDLIAIKRKEYLAATKKAAEQSRKRKLKEVKRRAKRRRLVVYSGSERSSDSSETDSGSPVGKFSSSSSTSSTSSSSEQEQSSPAQISEIFSKLTSQRQEQTAELQRLRTLRSRVLHSDSDSDSTSAGPSSDRVNLKKHTKGCVESTESVSSPGQLEAGACPEDTGREVGPHLAESNFENKVPLMRYHSLNSEAEPSTSGVERSSLNVISTNNAATHNHSSSHKKGSDSVTSSGPSTSQLTHNMVLNTNAVDTVSNSQDLADSDSNNTTWEEFKRLRRKVKRHYRRQSRQTSRSSEEET